MGRDGFRTQLWPLPTLAVVVAIALGVSLPALEAAYPELVPAAFHAYLFSGRATAARTVLDTIAGSLITVTALTFSLTVVTLQLASSQFSPRLLRTFTRDLTVQRTLGLFLGTFAYTLTVLRTVRTGTEWHSEFVPGISITLAYALTVGSVIALILFPAHLAQTIRVESMLRNVHNDASATLGTELDVADGAPPALASLLPDRPSSVLTAASSGVVMYIRQGDLLDAAVSADAIVVVETTAVNALSHSSALLVELAARDLGPLVLRDEEETVRVILARPDLAVLLRLAVGQPGRYGAQEPAVLVRLSMLLAELAWVCAPHQRPAVADELARLRRLVERSEPDDEQAAELADCAARVDAALDGRWPVATRT